MVQQQYFPSSSFSSLSRIDNVRKKRTLSISYNAFMNTCMSGAAR